MSMCRSPHVGKGVISRLSNSPLLTRGLLRRGAVARDKGFTLFELVVTLTVLAILIMGTIPLAQNSVKRQREIRLRETLRQIRNAIDEFKRDTYGACPAGSVSTGDLTRPNTGANVPSDPRSRVV